MLRAIALVFLLFGVSPLQAADEKPVILVMGDSLSAAYGMSVSEGWVALLQQRLTREGYPHRLVNASISGETTGGALSRLSQALKKYRPAVVIIELGGNDGLRGLAIDSMRDNLAKMIQQSRAAKAQILLTGIYLPENYGPQYTQKFRLVYDELVAKYKVVLVPFFMDGVALNREMMQADGIHPNAAGQPRLLENVWPYLQPLLEPKAIPGRSQAIAPATN